MFFKTEIENDTKKIFGKDNNKNLIELPLLKDAVLDSGTEVNNYNFNLSISEEISEKFQMRDEKTTIAFRLINQKLFQSNKSLIGLWEKLRFKKEKKQMLPSYMFDMRSY
jgi:hypothetical protein